MSDEFAGNRGSPGHRVIPDQRKRLIQERIGRARDSAN
jgi:hypothetical protein